MTPVDLIERIGADLDTLRDMGRLGDERPVPDHVYCAACACEEFDRRLGHRGDVRHLAEAQAHAHAIGDPRAEALLRLLHVFHMRWGSEILTRLWLGVRTYQGPDDWFWVGGMEQRWLQAVYPDPVSEGDPHA